MFVDVRSALCHLRLCPRSQTGGPISSLRWHRPRLLRGSSPDVCECQRAHFILHVSSRTSASDELPWQNMLVKAPHRQYLQYRDEAFRAYAQKFSHHKVQFPNPSEHLWRNFRKGALLLGWYWYTLLHKNVNWTLTSHLASLGRFRSVIRFAFFFSLTVFTKD